MAAMRKQHFRLQRAQTLLAKLIVISRRVPPHGILPFLESSSIESVMNSAESEHSWKGVLEPPPKMTALKLSKPHPEMGKGGGAWSGLVLVGLGFGWAWLGSILVTLGWQTSG